MNELPPQAASVLEQARRADQPDEFDLERSLASLHAALPFADVARTARWDQSEPRWPDRGPSGPSTFAGAAFSGKAIKLLLVTVVLGGIGAGAVQMHGSSVQRAAFAVNAQSSAAPAAFRSAGEIEPGFLARHEPANPPGRATETEHHGAIDASTRRPQSPAHAVRSERRQRTGRTRRASRFVAPVELDSAGQTSEMPATVAGAKPLASPSVDGRDQPPEAPPASAQAARGELDLIDSAIASLRLGDERRALELLEQHRARYPAGKFAVERNGLNVLALCASGRIEEGRAARAAFLRSESRPPILSRVREACVDNPGRR